jgi:hypothetical protein
MCCVLILVIFVFLVSQSEFEIGRALVFILVKKSYRLGYFHVCKNLSQKEYIFKKNKKRM